ncbi:MAG: 16S rRNA (guanine(527)-N(7))-methyltransferase RsmG [Clostridia bacterium]|nr:16S rRNA (guanine(527)-N(7))-methyltransferase RsmG [Clostridia bacterium]
MEWTEKQFAERFCGAMKKNGLPFLSRGDLAERFYLLTDLLLESNRVMNLTAITDVAEMIDKHYVDCASLLPMLPREGVVADIGTGAGFPALPIAILSPGLRVCAVDSTEKKLGFVKDAADRLGLTNLTVLAGRAEELGKNPEWRESFDAVTARAVARLNILCEYCLPLVRTHGIFLSMKGKNAPEEVREASRAIEILGGELISCETVPLQTEEGPSERGIVSIRKNKKTPGIYPRSNAVIRRNPL